MKTLYLAGPINGCSDDEARGWRETVKARLSGLYEFLDPMDRDYRGKERGHAQDIVNGDVADILRADAILVYAERASWGTAMELVYARMLGKPVYAIYGGYEPSPWLEYHTISRFASLETACDWFQEYAGGATKREPHLALRRRSFKAVPSSQTWTEAP